MTFTQLSCPATHFSEFIPTIKWYMTLLKRAEIGVNRYYFNELFFIYTFQQQRIPTTQLCIPNAQTMSINVTDIFNPLPQRWKNKTDKAVDIESWHRSNR